MSAKHWMVLGVMALTVAAAPLTAIAAEEVPSDSTAVADAGTKNAAATLDATLVDKDKKAAEKAATVKVDVQNFDIVDPADVNEEPKDGQGHLHYQVDNGPVIATTAKKLSFHELASGEHTIKVMLATNDHKPIKEKDLNLTIP